MTDLGREGGLDACARYGHDASTLGHRSKFSIRGESYEADYRISIRAGKEPRIIGESLQIGGRKLAVFEVIPSMGLAASADNRIDYDDHNARTKKEV